MNKFMKLTALGGFSTVLFTGCTCLSKPTIAAGGVTIGRVKRVL
jgi:hypothetical protein